jgi:drug/metabolite transporter (DMT)-like permease
MTAGSDHIRGIALVTLGVIVLSPDTLLIRLIEADRWTLLCARGFLLAVALGGYSALRDRGKTVAHFRTLGAMGFLVSGFFALSTILFVNSVRLTAVSNTLVILSAMPLVAAVLGKVFFSETLPHRTWVAAFITVCGIAVIFSGSLNGGAPAGDFSALGTTAAMAAVLVILRHNRQINALVAMSLGGLIGGIATLPVATLSTIGARDLAFLLLLGLFVVPVAFGLITTVGPRYLSAPEVSLIMLVESLLGPLWVWLIIGEVPPAETIIGGAVVLGALVVHYVLSLSDGRRDHAERLFK